MGRKVAKPKSDFSQHYSDHAIEDARNGVPGSLDPRTFFKAPVDPATPVELEIGCGKGLFLAREGARRPGVAFLAMEWAVKYAQVAAHRAARAGLTNVHVCRADAKPLLRLLRDHCLQALHVYFPDPWWKKKHRKRRMVDARFVAEATRLLELGGTLQLATDVAEYYQVMLAELEQAPQFVRLPDPDPSVPEHDHDYLTHFERKYRLEGRPIYRAQYRLAAIPASQPDPESRPPLDPVRLQALADGRRYIGTRVEVLASTDSTNDRCHEQAAAESSRGGGAGLAIFAEHQTSGRGQQGRVWSAPPRSALLFSLLLEPPAGLAAPELLAAWSALGVALALRGLLPPDGPAAEMAGARPITIKWPNDVLLFGKKVCGILVERRVATVVGIGVNVSIGDHEFPADLRQPATALETALARPIDRTDLAATLLQTLDRLYAQAMEQGPAAVLDQWPAYSLVQPGDWVAAHTHHETITGVLEDLHPGRGATVAPVNGLPVTLPMSALLRVVPAQP